MLDFQDSSRGMHIDFFDKDVNKKMLWLWSTGRMLAFRDSGEETEMCDVNKGFNKNMF